MSGTGSVDLNTEVLYKPFRDGLLLLNLGDQRIYYMNSIASRMWTLLLEHGTPSAVIRDLTIEYAADETLLQKDVEMVTLELVRTGLLRNC